MPKDGPERTKPSPDSAVCSNLLLPRSTFTESTSTEPGVVCFWHKVVVEETVLVLYRLILGNERLCLYCTD